MVNTASAFSVKNKMNIASKNLDVKRFSEKFSDILQKNGENDKIFAFFAFFENEFLPICEKYIAEGRQATQSPKKEKDVKCDRNFLSLNKKVIETLLKIAAFLAKSKDEHFLGDEKIARDAVKKYAPEAILREYALLLNLFTRDNEKSAIFLLQNEQQTREFLAKYVAEYGVKSECVFANITTAAVHNRLVFAKNEAFATVAAFDVFAKNENSEKIIGAEFLFDVKKGKNSQILRVYDEKNDTFVDFCGKKEILSFFAEFAETGENAKICFCTKAETLNIINYLYAIGLPISGKDGGDYDAVAAGEKQGIYYCLSGFGKESSEYGCSTYFLQKIIGMGTGADSNVAAEKITICATDAIIGSGSYPVFRLVNEKSKAKAAFLFLAKMNEFGCGIFGVSKKIMQLMAYNVSVPLLKKGFYQRKDGSLCYLTQKEMYSLLFDVRNKQVNTLFPPLIKGFRIKESDVSIFAENSGKIADAKQKGKSFSEMNRGGLTGIYNKNSDLGGEKMFMPSYVADGNIVASIDINSAYPKQMRDIAIPIGAPKKRAIRHITDAIALYHAKKDTHFLFFRGEYEIRLPKQVPFFLQGMIRTAADDNYVKFLENTTEADEAAGFKRFTCKKNEIEFYSGGEWLSSDDFDFIKKNGGSIKIYSVSECREYEAARGIFCDYVDFLINIKKQAKGGDAVKYWLSKLLLNGCYGLLGKRQYFCEMQIKTNAYTALNGKKIFSISEEFCDKKEGAYIGESGHFAACAAISGAQRIAIAQDCFDFERKMADEGGRCIYIGTDSIKIALPHGLCENDASDWLDDCLGAETFSEKELGKYKKEYYAQNFYALGANTYAYQKNIDEKLVGFSIFSGISGMAGKYYQIGDEYSYFCLEKASLREKEKSGCVAFYAERKGQVSPVFNKKDEIERGYYI